MSAVVVDGVTKVYDLDGTHLTALDDVTFAAEAGTATSIVGPNGAGKSTLVRVIAGITRPTEGQVSRASRVASVTELGSGFHPDLGAAENLRLGLVLAGMGRGEARRVAPDALAFAGLVAHRDVPTRHLSSGMAARLACALALHTPCDVLLLDEALAVGDAEFQQRAVATVRERVADGLALLLVTHSTALAAATTTRTVWLEGGRVREVGDAADVLPRYEATMSRRRHPGHGSAQLTGIEVGPTEIAPGEGFVVRGGLLAAAPCDLEVLVEVRTRVGQLGRRRTAEEEAIVRRDNLVATSDPLVIHVGEPGAHTIEVEVDSIPVTDAEVEVELLVLDRTGGLVDRAAADLTIGRRPGRPTYLMAAAAGPAPERPQP